MSYANIPIVVFLYSHSNFEGGKVVLTEDTPSHPLLEFGDSLGGGHGPNPSSIKIVAGPNFNPDIKYQVSFFQHKNYKGGHLVLYGPGEYPDLKHPYNFNDMISSVKFNYGVPIPQPIQTIPLAVELYQNYNFDGFRLVALQDIPNLNSYGVSNFNDYVSSVKVFPGPNYVAGKKARLFEHPNAGGTHIELPVGSYPNLKNSHSFNDKISSVYVS